jgi:hypothetical protein
MFRISYCVLIASIILTSSCQKEVNQEWGKIPAPLADSLTSLFKTNQLFEIDPTKSNTIVGDKGTVILIEENSIVDSNDKPVTGKISVLVKEHFTMADFVVSNLQTVHQDRLLESAGMIYLSARDAQGKELKIAKGKSIRLQIPQDTIREGAKIFLGKRDEKGLMNWNTYEETTKTLAVYPIKFLSKLRSPDECLDYYGITQDTLKIPIYNYYGKITDFENTLLATKEFRDRFSWHCWKEVLNLYIHNLDKNMWEIDEMMVEKFKEDSIQEIYYYKNHPPSTSLGSLPTKDQWKAHQALLEMQLDGYHRYIEAFKFFARQRLTKIDPSKKVDTTQLKELNTPLATYDALQFGWVNVDFFYNDPAAVPIRLVAKTSGEVSWVNLIVKDRNVILSGIDHGHQEYWFTKTDIVYSKLPKGAKAIIFAIGYKDGGLTFGEKEIVIGDKEQEDIQINKVTGEQLKTALEKYNSRRK